ncbi:MAG: Rrf2 family transcriptional regulator [Deltaproteobacteria bacterium]
MKLSTRSRYGVRLMIALAAAGRDKSVFLKDIAASEDISGKYLSLIVIPLRAAGLIRSIRGARGGYVLAREPQDISLCDIVEAVEGKIDLVNCVKNPDVCPRAEACTARDTWTELSHTIREAMGGVNLARLVTGQEGKKGITRPKVRQIKKGS